jgi:hypothetical protein
VPFKITDDIRVRQSALDAVLRAAASLKGWELKSGGELLAEASIVEQWIRTGNAKKDEKSARPKKR